MSTEYLATVFLVCPRFVNGEYVSDFGMIRDEVLLRLDSWTADQLDAFGFNGPLDLRDEGDDVDVTWRDEALNHIEQVFLDYVVNEAPGVNRIALDDSRHHIVAGGMISGYSDEGPSAEYEEILPVAVCEIFEEPFGMGDQMVV